MMVKFKEKLRYIWHGIYYVLSFSPGQKLALTCKEAVAQMEVEDSSRSWVSWFRLKLHISLCQACNNYYRASQALGRALRKVMDNPQELDIEKINEELLQKYAGVIK